MIGDMATATLTRIRSGSCYVLVTWRKGMTGEEIRAKALRAPARPRRDSIDLDWAMIAERAIVR